VWSDGVWGVKYLLFLIREGVLAEALRAETLRGEGVLAEALRARDAKRVGGSRGGAKGKRR
jgi:hypothetical protein